MIVLRKWNVMQFACVQEKVDQVTKSSWVIRP